MFGVQRNEDTGTSFTTYQKSKKKNKFEKFKSEHFLFEQIQNLKF
jgi:hypothetical protein